jgi:hypothetical protein
LLDELIQNTSGSGLKELRITGINAPKNILVQIVKALEEPNDLKKLKLSDLQFNNDYNLTQSLNKVIKNNCQLISLTISRVGLFAGQLATLVKKIS